jgi:hypothetical protein
MDWRNNMKKLLIAALLLASTVPAYAGPLDLIFDAPGNFWGRVEGSVNPWGNNNHTQAMVEQGIRFDHLTWLTFYGGFTWWQDVETSRIGYWQAGVKNTTWVPNWIFGIEEEDYVVQQPVLANQTGQHFVVAYVSASYDWNLRHYK